MHEKEQIASDDISQSCIALRLSFDSDGECQEAVCVDDPVGVPLLQLKVHHNEDSIAIALQTVSVMVQGSASDDNELKDAMFVGLNG